MHRHDAVAQRKLRLWLAAAWLISLAATAWGTWMFASHPGLVPAVANLGGHRAELKQLRTDNERLQQQVADLQRSQQVNDVAMRSLRGTLTEREEQLSGLRADLGFYSRLVGSDSQRQGLKVQEVRVQPVPQSNAWNLTLSLTQNARRGDEIHGNVTVTVEGLRGEKVEKLDWNALGDAAQTDGLPFQFKYFQQVHCTFVLPKDFRPMRLRINAAPSQGNPATRSVAWNEALNGNITNAQGDHDAQP